MEQRIKTLEAAYTRPMTTIETARALCDRIAAIYGDVMTAEELIREAEVTTEALGAPYTVERYAAYIAERDGIPLADLMATAQEIAEATS